MTTKEQSRRCQAQHQISYAQEGVQYFVEGALRLLLAALCSGAKVFAHYHPFGLALVASSGAGMAGFCTLSGASAGYLLVLPLNDALHYVAASVLTYAVSFAIHDSRLSKTRFFMPLAGALICLGCRLIPLLNESYQSKALVLTLLEPLLLAICTPFYALILPPRMRALPKCQSPKEQVAAFVLLATVLSALDGMVFWGEFSLGHILAAFAVMFLARNGLETGLLVGVLMGITLDLTSGRHPYYSLIYALAGASAGLCHQKGKVLTALAYLLTTSLLVLWTWESGMRVALLYEVAVASALFCLLPQAWYKCGHLAKRESTTPARDWQHTRQQVIRQVQAKASAFQQMYESLREHFQHTAPSDEDSAVIFERSADRACRSCKLRERCWIAEFQTTEHLLLDSLPPMLARGTAEGNDFSPHFRSRCVHFSAFLEAVNHELTAFLYRRQYAGRLEENRLALCAQYAQLEAMLNQTATDLAEDPLPDPKREEHLQHFLQKQGLSTEGRVYFTPQGHLQVETPAHAHFRTEAGLQQLSELLSTPLRPAVDMDSGLSFSQAEPFLATAGVFGRCKAGESQSGDHGTWFRRDDGLLCILLCDGMGSGEKARQESTLAAQLLQNFLRAGVEASLALTTVNAALTLRCDEACSTIDLLTLDLFNGLCHIYKLGAAPTYLRRGESIHAIAGKSLPLGLLSESENQADMHTLRLVFDDWLILLSDGMIQENDDSLQGLIASYEGNSPGELAQYLVSTLVPEHNQDDATVIALHVVERKDKHGGKH